MTIWSAWRMYLYHLLALPRTTQSNHQFTDQIPINLPTKFPSIYRPTSHQFTDQLPFNLPTNFPSIYRPTSLQFTDQLPINLPTKFPSIYQPTSHQFTDQLPFNLPTSRLFVSQTNFRFTDQFLEKVSVASPPPSPHGANRF